MSVVTTSDWDPNDPALKDPNAPHETGGLARMNRHGMKMPDVLDTFPHRTRSSVVSEMTRVIDQETDAGHRGVPIHDAGIEIKHG